MDNENRFNKIDDAIQRLAVVAADLSRMLAVQEQRLTQQEKASDNVMEMVEKRRVEYDEKISDVYKTMRAEDNTILAEIKKSREDSSSQHKKLDEKIANIEKMIWMACGGGTVIGFLISLAVNYLKVAH
jgi:conjugal transfer/entry exclusion protein